MSYISPDLGRKLIEILDRDCAVASSVAATLRSRDGRLTEGMFLKDGLGASDLGSISRSLHCFSQMGWCFQSGDHWQSAGARIPDWVPAFLAGAAATFKYGRPEN